MARPATGGIVRHPGKDGDYFALRVRADGRRWYVSLGKVTREAAEAELRKVVRAIGEGKWVPPASVAHRKRLARKQLKDASSECYVRVRKALEACDQALGQANGSAAATFFQRAQHRLYEAEDDIVAGRRLL